MKKFRNILAMLMVFVMLVAVMPMNVFAADPETGTVETGEGDGTGDQEETPEQKLAKAKETAKTTVNALENLTEEEKKGFTDRIDKASKIEEIQPIVEEAKTKAEAKKEHNITIKDSKNGKVEADKKTAKKDDVVTLTITPKTGYKLKELKVMAGETKVEVKENKFKMPAADVTVTATFEEDKKPETKEYTISKAYTNHGSFTVDKTKAKAGETITVAAKPDYGYAVDSIYYIDNNNVKHIIKNYSYNDHYYYNYNDRYYGDYYRYYSDYENNYYHDYSSYDAYLKDRHYSFWNNGYRYWDDYDYKYYNRYYDRYNDRYYDAYDSDYYRYYDDYVDNYYRRYSSYEDYLYDKHYSHYRDYRYYDRYDYRYYNYTTTDTFTMPASDVTVYVEFTDWSYYGYYYDDYYYYRYHRDKKDKDKEEEKAKEEEKVVEEKTPQVFEASATINVGSKVFTKVNKNVTTTHQMDVAAYVKNGRVMLPLRYVAEALGLQVSWVPQTKTVIIWDLTQKVEIPIKSNKMIVNGVTYTSDVKPEINSSRTMLPIANIARALGLIDGSDIIWDPVMKQVKLTRRVISK